MNHPRVLFHGTNRSYVEEQLERYGAYKHEPLFGDVQLTKSPEWATNVAHTRMFEYSGSKCAVVLVIDTALLTSGLKTKIYKSGVVPPEEVWITPYLDQDAFEIVPVINGWCPETRERLEIAAEEFSLV